MKKMKKLFDFLFRWDGLWSVPLLILGFIAFGIFSVDFFGEGVSTYDPGILQSLFLASAFIVAINLLTWLGIRFNFPDLFEYMTGTFHEDFYNLAPWQRVLISFAVYFFLFSAVLFLLSLIL